MTATQTRNEAETEAGRWLLSNVKPNYTPPESGKTFTEHIAAIEAESRQATVERIRSAVDWNVPGHAELEEQLAAALDKEAAR